MGPQDGATVETLTRNADLALYKSNDKGGNVVAPYVPSLHAQDEERRVMEQELRGALDRGEFALYYQPVVTAEDGNSKRYEAPLRWTTETMRAGRQRAGQAEVQHTSTRWIAGTL